MDQFEALARSAAELQWRLGMLEPGQYQRPSACPDWSTFELVNHVIGGAIRYRLLLRHVDPIDVEATRAEDHVGDEPTTAFHEAVVALDMEFRAPGALERAVRHRTGERSGQQLLRMRILEQTLHGWDLARTLGVDATIDEELVRFVLVNCTALVTELRKAGMYAPPADPDQAPTPQERLLRIAGRNRE